MSKASLGIWGKTHTITTPTDINLAAESNAIPMHTAYQTLGQSLLGMPHVEDTPAADITYKMSLCGRDQCHPNAHFLSNTKPVLQEIQSADTPDGPDAPDAPAPTDDAPAGNFN